MVYSLLYEAWKREKENQELQPLDREFYPKLGQYIKDQGEELQLLDEKTLKARLMSEEKERIKKLLTDLACSRFRKIFRKVLEGKTIPTDLLTPEEEIACSGVSSAWEQIENVLEDVLRGRSPRVKEVRLVEKPKRILVRFLQAIPSIIGPDMKAYGPFKDEDIASLPAENAEVLIKRGVVVEVETQ